MGIHSSAASHHQKRRPAAATLATRDEGDVLGSTSIMSSADALDHAFDGRRCRLVRGDGSSRAMPTHLWSGVASATDVARFVAPCTGPTLDVGCGPGRLSEALSRRGIDVLGVDISLVAVRQTRRRGANALCRDILEDPGPTGLWRHILLADGNIGIGGDPVRLLGRLTPLLAADGTILIEVAPAGGVAIKHLRMQVESQISGAFAWATVGLDAVEDLSMRSGLEVQAITRVAGRTAVALGHRSPDDRVSAGRPEEDPQEAPPNPGADDPQDPPPDNPSGASRPGRSGLRAVPALEDDECRVCRAGAEPQAVTWPGLS